MIDKASSPAVRAIDAQRKAVKTFHRTCISEGQKNLRQAAGSYLPMAILADFALAIGVAMEMAEKLKSRKDVDRLRRLGAAELSAMGLQTTDEERVEMDVVLDTIPDSEDVKSLVAVGLKRVRTDAAGRRFAGMAPRVRAVALVQRLGGNVTIVEKDVDPIDQPVESAVPSGGEIENTTEGLAAAAGPKALREPPAESAFDTAPDLAQERSAPHGTDPVASPPLTLPVPRPALRLSVPPRLGAFGADPDLLRPAMPHGPAQKQGHDAGRPDDAAKPLGSS